MQKKLSKVTSWVLLGLYSSTGTAAPVKSMVDIYNDSTSRAERTLMIPYVVVQGDTLFNIAKRYDLSVKHLKELNGFSLESFGDKIQVGQIIYIPHRPKHNLPELGSNNIKANNTDSSVVESFIAGQASRLGQTYGKENENNTLLSSEDRYKLSSGRFADTKATTTNQPDFLAQEESYLKQQARSLFEAEASERINDLVGHFGTAEFSFKLDDDFKLSDYSVDLLMPLYDVPERVAFIQAGSRYNSNSERTIVNLGLGQRHFVNDWMLGYNAFFDYDILRHHTRLGLGAEAWTDYLKISANYYTPLSDWKDSHDFDDYLERAARGFDINAKYYLPSYPQFGVSATVEQYFGDEVDLLGSKQLERNPYSGKIGLEWQPIPLVKVGVDHRQAKGGDSDTQFSLGLEWKIGASLDDMLNPANVALSRQLQGMRYDLVERNNNMVLEYKEKARTISIEHADIAGVSGETFTLDPQVKLSKGEIVNWQWSSPDPLLDASLANRDQKNASLTLPVLPLDVLIDKEYTLYLTVTDERGRTYQSQQIKVVVRVNPDLLMMRLRTITEGYEADSIQSPRADITVDDGSTIVEFQLDRMLKTDTSNAVVVETREVIFEPLEFFDIEILDSEQRPANNQLEWVRKLRLIPKQPGAVALPEVLSFHAIGVAGVPSGQLHLNLVSAQTIDPAATPLISDLRMSGKLEVGQSLGATFNFNANGGEPTDTSTYAWGHLGATAANVAAGASVTTSGQVPAQLLTAADVGEVMEVSVQAKNGLGVTGNTETVSTRDNTAGGNDTTSGADTNGDGRGDVVIDTSATPLISDLRMSGKLEVGQSLGATFNFNANGGEPTDTSTYAWGHQGATAANVAAGASVTTSGQVPAQLLTAADVGEVMEVSVQAKNGLGVTGNTETVSTRDNTAGGNDTTSGADTNGDGRGDVVIDTSATPLISDLRMSGKLEVGQSLGATFNFNANGGEPTDTSTYAWGHQGATAANVAAGASVTTSGQVPAQLLTAADVGEVMEVSVQAKNGLGVTGNTETVSTLDNTAGGNETTSGADTNGDGRGDVVIDLTNLTVRVVYTSSATLADNADNGVRPVVNHDQMTAECQLAGEPAFTQCDSRYDLQWHVGGSPVAGETAATFTGTSNQQGLAVQVEVTLKP